MIDMLSAVALVGGLSLLGQWYFNEQKKKRKSPVKQPWEGSSLPVSREEKMPVKKTPDVPAQLNPKPLPTRLDENWLKRELNDLGVYLHTPSVVDKFFQRLRLTYTTPRDTQLINAYAEKVKALVNLAQAGVDFEMVNVKLENLDKLKELERLKIEAEIEETKARKIENEHKANPEAAKLVLEIRMKELEKKAAELEKEKQGLKEDKTDKKEHVETVEDYRKKVDQDTEKKKIRARQIEILYGTAEEKFRKWRQDFCSDIGSEPEGSKIRWEKEGNWLEDIKKALGEEVNDAVERYEEYKDRVYEELGLNNAKR